MSVPSTAPGSLDCATPPAAILVWEERHLVVPLRLAIPSLSLADVPAPVAQQVERAIGLAVGHAEFEGWQPGEPIDLAALWYAGRVLTQRRSNALHPDRARSYTIEGVTIRLLRLVLAPPVEHTLGRRE